MENKYYTPSIEEFHVGFEYERGNGNDWEETEITQDDFSSVRRELGGENEFDEIHTGIRTVRVKHLDKEDIESLGFICKQKPLASWNEGEFWVKDKEDVVIMDFDILDRTNPEISFNNINFIIKNKSELKRLLKQLGINGQD